MIQSLNIVYLVRCMSNHPYIERLLSHRIRRAFEQFPCIVLLGARQVGKTTLLKHLYPQLDCVTFDPVQDIRHARQDPDLFLANHNSPLILDEIQYVPELVPALKRQIDRNRKPGQYLLTGSQQWGVLRDVAESLAGRVIILHLDGFSLAEISRQQETKPWLERWMDPNLSKDFLSPYLQRLPLSCSLYELIWRGCLPETHFLPLEFIPDFQSSYQRTYIERDIRLLANVSDIQQFGRFIRLAAAHTGQEINHSELGRDIGVTPQTAKRWLNTLTEAFEWFEIPPFSQNAIKKISGKPKGYFADTGQVCFSQMISTPAAIAAHPLWGALFENAVVSELQKQILLIPTPPRIYHWRLHSGAEVDLIFERDGRFFPVEIKAKTRPTARDASGITAFRKHYPHLHIERGLIVAPADTAWAVTEKDFVIPWDVA